MKTINRICTGLLVFGLLCLSGIAAAQDEAVLTDDITAYNGPIGADSPLYGLKLALEDMDESFTANETERVDKQVNHARLRLTEVRRSLELNQSDSAEQALNNYWMKMNLTNATISRWGSNGTGLLHAQEQIVRHQFVLEHLLEAHPNNTGLRRAYNNSIRLEERFGEKTMIRFNRTVEKNNQTIMKAIRLEQKENNRKGWADVNATVTATTDDKQKGWDKDKGKTAGNGNPVTSVTMQALPTNQQQGQQGNQQSQGQGQGQGSQPDNNANGNAGDKVKGNSKNK